MGILEDAAEGARQAVEAMKAASQASDDTTVNTVLSLLSAQEEEVVRYRYGLGREHLKTFRQIGEAMGLSAQRVGQIEHKARRRLSWFVRCVGPIGSPAFARYSSETLARRAEIERLRRERIEQEAATKARRRAEKAERDEVRRARARSKAWQRKIDTLVMERDAVAGTIARLRDRISEIERRGWLARYILPHDRVLARLYAKLADLEAKVKAAGSGIARLRASPPS
ncbi:hypothetical protein D2V17_11225 [Aurantiacibacter xanthus]|jgi:DNA repair exonuclease SbcCD ATPase subunit|uniref:RNA polymerase sigma-70 region 4 domain-containing protein n=1 Tax=Aurantiacibacter xanthus TaxID=1784712 RepID=A0A3A1P3I1_9SPHN|nr:MULTISPECIES: sigma factor-like helix-turn-helix DNA-binding protein [Sphingomonadales]RIV84840.1 hypothetical protein D2V17_11225 [Aurantiacibacter xanthus]